MVLIYKEDKMENQFKKFEELTPFFSELKKEVQIDKSKLVDDKDDDCSLTIFPSVDTAFLKENAGIITPDSFVYMYALSDEEREYVDSVRESKKNDNQEPIRTLKKKTSI